MNLLLLYPEDGAGESYRIAGPRARHLVKVLGVAPGRSLRVGQLDGPLGDGTVTHVDAADGPGEGPSVHITVRWLTAEPEPTFLELFLAMPRPHTLKKLLPQLATIGVRRLVLFQCERVEKNYFHSPLLRPERYTPLLDEGLMQGRRTRRPELSVVRWPQRLLDGPLSSAAARFVAHVPTERPVESLAVPPDGPIQLAVGPEGGFRPEEIEKFEACGFVPFHSGTTPLRVETATITLAGQLRLLRSQAQTRPT